MLEINTVSQTMVNARKQQRSEAYMGTSNPPYPTLFSGIVAAAFCRRFFS